jgi:broad specificity phosphatase PhoE
MAMTCIVLVRHGHVPGITPERFRGRANLELTDRGLAEARATATRIAQSWRPTILYTSPMQRCVITGQFIAERCHVPALVLDDLNDVDYGAWQGKTCDEVREGSPVEYQRWRNAPHLTRFPEGESLQQLAARVADGLRFVMQHHPDETIVMVGHDCTNRVLLLQALELPVSAFWRISQAPCAINEIVILDASHMTVLCVNETAHLAAMP